MNRKRPARAQHLFCLLLCLLLLGCDASRQETGKAKKLPSVETALAQKRHLIETIETTGEIIAANTVTLEATVEGPISFCPWREGDRIERAGEKLIEIDRPLYRQELAMAEAACTVARAKLEDLKAGARPEEIRQAQEKLRNLEACTTFARNDLDRLAVLVTSGALPAEAEEKARVSFITCQTQFETEKEALAMLEEGPTATEIRVAQASLDEATAKVGLARAKLAECLLTAPFAGLITEVYVRQGDLATPRAKLLKIMDPSSLVVRVGLPESSAIHLRLGAEATVQLDAYPGKTFPAKISRIYPRIETASRTRLVELSLVDSVPLLPHFFARVSVAGRCFEEAVTVPESALVTMPRGETVVFVVAEGKAQQREVKTGLEQDGHVQIIQGVAAGELVVTAGNLNLKNGTAVQLRSEAQSPKRAEKPAVGVADGGQNV